MKPPRMASGYAGGERLDDRLDPEGYVRTGDFARIDGDAFVWIEGRIGDVINRGGNKVFPGQVEEVLLLSPGVSEVAVVGLPDERLGEVPVAFVVGDASDAELDRAVPTAPCGVQGPRGLSARGRAAQERSRKGSAPRARWDGSWRRIRRRWARFRSDRIDRELYGSGRLSPSSPQCDRREPVDGPDAWGRAPNRPAECALRSRSTTGSALPARPVPGGGAVPSRGRPTPAM